ncbi:ras and Rab interactor 1 isoform X3 [Halichoerus grypus]|uniref:ras and Rab interactor 1 isoform X3 n=1 Tax=Halichoerus grypus TaxID=9711 RepID=UPI00165930BB|nr:ras and Rab interactor 1 isoform X3 [Halichoerus grypus]
METPGEPGAGPLGAPSLSNFAPGRPEREKPAEDPPYDVPGASGRQAGGPQRPGRTVSLRERLLLTRPVWLQLRANAAAALHVLRTEPPGTFLVRKSNTRGCQALCVRLPEAGGSSFVSSHYIQESPGGTSFSSHSSSPEPSARQPPTRNSKPSPIWALEVDCGSPSSSEEEGVPGSRGSPATSPCLGRRRPLLRSMSAAFCSLLAPERKVGRAASALTQDRHTAVGQLVQDLLTQVRAGPEPRELQGVREALSRARAMLSAELGPEKLLPPERLEHILEKSLHRSVLKPLRPILAARLRRRLSANGSLGRLAEGLRLARAQGPGAFGSHVSLPSPVEMEQVRQKLLQLLRAYSPSAQVKRLLQACKLLYTALRTHAGEGAGADEFLPLLSLVLAQCDLPELLLEAEYMSELLEPSLLTGEGGYYLTSLSASLALLSGLDQAHTLPLSPSQELQRSLSLWEQRRLPATHSSQHLLRVAYQDPSSGCTSKTLAVPPGASIATLNQLCATKFRVTQPDTFGLFLYKEQGYHRLPPGALAHRLPATGYLVYRRAERPETQGASPGASPEDSSGELEAGGREEEKRGGADGDIQVKAGPGDSRGESETVAERARRAPAQPGGPEAEGSRAAEE